MLFLNHRKYSRCIWTQKFYVQLLSYQRKACSTKLRNPIRLTKIRPPKTEKWNRRRKKEEEEPACFFSEGEPLRWRISRSTRPRDMRPRVRPDMIPAKMTRRQDIPAYTNHHTDPKGMPSGAPSWSRFIINALTTFIVDPSLLFFFFFSVLCASSTACKCKVQLLHLQTNSLTP